MKELPPIFSYVYRSAGEVTNIQFGHLACGIQFLEDVDYCREVGADVGILERYNT